MASRGRGRSNTSIVSGMSAGNNGDLVSQSGGRASTFQSTNGSNRNKYGPGSTGSRTPRGRSNIFPNLNIAIFPSGGDSATMRSPRKTPGGVNIRTTGNTGQTNVSIVRPKALGPKGFGGNYRLSKGY